MQIKEYSSNYQLRNKDNFKNFWKKLNSRDINNVRQQIDVLQYKGTPDSTIISNLQNRPKLAERYQAVRAFRTEGKLLESRELKTIAEDRGVKKFKIIPESGACQQCLDFSQGGRRVFTQRGLTKDGRDLPPIHPSCRCNLVLALK